MAEPREVVGREQELRLLRDFVGGDRARVVLLEGDAGIGKTTLMREAITAASSEGARVLAARPAAAEAGLAFAGLGDLLADVLEAIVTELPPPQAAALEVAFLRRKAEGRSVDLHTVSAGVLAALRALGERDAVVVAVDDLQWLDRETLAALAFAFRRLGDERVRLIAALRSDHGRALPALIESLPPERITRIQIGSLSAGTLHEVIRIHAGRTLPRPVLLRIHELTDGNPFYALEIVRSLPPDEPPSGFQMPPSVEALTTRRLGRLEGPVRRVLEPAALLRDPTVSLLKALSKEPRQVDQRLDRAVSAGVIELSVDRIRFTHPLLAEAMATMIGPRRRSQLHAELAQLVEDPEQRARHLALVSSRPCTETADEIERGARVAAARGAPAAAAELLEMAAAVTPDSQPSSRWRRTIEAARACKPAGLPARGRKLLATVLSELPSGTQRADALIGLAELSNDDFEAADRALKQALIEARGDYERLSIIHRERAYGCGSHVGYAAAREHAELAIAAATRAGEARVLIPALTFLAALETWSGSSKHGVLEQALELQRREHLPLAYTSSPNVILGLRHMSVDRLDEARELFEAEAADAESGGDDYTYSSLLVYLTELECRAGNFSAAASHASECWLRSEQRGEQFQEGQRSGPRRWSMRIWGVSRRLARQPCAGRPFRPAPGKRSIESSTSTPLVSSSSQSGTPSGLTPCYDRCRSGWSSSDGTSRASSRSGRTRSRRCSQPENTSSRATTSPCTRKGLVDATVLGRSQRPHAATGFCASPRGRSTTR